MSDLALKHTQAEIIEHICRSMTLEAIWPMIVRLSGQ